MKLQIIKYSIIKQTIIGKPWEYILFLCFNHSNQRVQGDCHWFRFEIRLKINCAIPKVVSISFTRNDTNPGFIAVIQKPLLSSTLNTMPSFSLSNEESIVFNSMCLVFLMVCIVTPSCNCESHLTVTNTSDSHVYLTEYVCEL